MGYIRTLKPASIVPKKKPSTQLCHGYLRGATLIIIKIWSIQVTILYYCF